MRIITTDPTALLVNTQQVTINQRFSAGTVKAASRFSNVMGTDVVDILVGVIPNGSTEVQTFTMTVPQRRLLNGIKYDCIRTIRFNVLLNIITSWADKVKDVDLLSNSVVFLGFGTRR